MKTPDAVLKDAIKDATDLASDGGMSASDAALAAFGPSRVTELRQAIADSLGKKK